MIRGPITGGNHGWAFGRPLFELATRGYVEEEFFLEGEATTYRPVAGAELGRDGQWQVEPKGKLPFRTRFLVYRPADPSRFNGTVVVCWNNVTAGYELFNGETPRSSKAATRMSAPACSAWAYTASRPIPRASRRGTHSATASSASRATRARMTSTPRSGALSDLTATGPASIRSAAWT